MNRLKNLFLADSVLFISMAAALISIFFVAPSKKYLDYIDLKVIIMLFCLMGVVAAFRKIGVFNVVTDFLLSRTSSARMIVFIMMNLCFFSSMLVTNDVALITFVPLTIGIASHIHDKKFLIKTIVIETVAANLGSMMTPIGNPQNLFLYSHFNLSAMDFLKTLLPLGVLGYILLCISLLLIKKEKISYKKTETQKIALIKPVIYIILFAVCLLSVADIIDKNLCLVIASVVLLFTEKEVFKKIDYSLLATFICFFIFVGNLSSLPSISKFISGIMDGRETLVSALLSQIISNVPAAIMLAGFTDKALPLLAGVNIGGMGTPVASLASLISFRYYSAVKNSEKVKYMSFFLIYNFVFFVILMAFNIIFL